MSVKSFLSAVHLNGDQKLSSKMLTSPKLKELQDPYLYISYHYYLLPAHKVSCNSAKQLRRNAIKTLYRVCDDPYHACIFAWGILRVLFTPH